jgi:hypothetical protein
MATVFAAHGARAAYLAHGKAVGPSSAGSPSALPVGHVVAGDLDPRLDTQSRRPYKVTDFDYLVTLLDLAIGILFGPFLNSP